MVAYVQIVYQFLEESKGVWNPPPVLAVPKKRSPERVNKWKGNANLIKKESFVVETPQVAPLPGPWTTHISGPQTPGCQICGCDPGISRLSVFPPPTAHDTTKEYRPYSCYISMVLKLDGNSELVVHASRKIGFFGEEKNPTCDCSRSN